MAVALRGGLVETEREVSPDEARGLLQRMPGVAWSTIRRPPRYPMPSDAAGGDDVLVGRIRRDASRPNGLAIWWSPTTSARAPR